MSFYVVEGDNGTGKDTLALKLQEKYGYMVITNEEDIVKLNKEAKTFEGKERVKKFIEYGKICSDKAKNSKQNVILVRYWISTLAAAYADNIFSYEEVCKIEEEICSKFYKPDGIICLTCDFDKRIERIENRKSDDFDDITRNRNDRYKWFLNKMQEKIDINWVNIDTTRKSIDEVFKEVCKYVSVKDNKYYDER